MRIGLSVTSRWPGVPPGDAVAMVLERIEVAAAAGFDHLTMGDHHAVGPDDQYLQGVPMMARALAEWPADRPAGPLFLVPLWHPVLMAELIGTLDAMIDAPLVVQAGIGAGRRQFSAMGAELGTRGRDTTHRIELVQALLRGERVDDQALGIDGASIGPRPRDGVEWWIGAGRVPAALDRAARLGDALYASPGADLEQVAALVADYRGRCAALGRPARVVLRRDVVLSDDADRAAVMADDVIASGYRGMSRDRLVAGDVATTVDAFRAYGEIGVDEISVRVASIPQPEALRTLELVGEVRRVLVGDR